MKINRTIVSAFLGKRVEIVLFDNDKITGEFHKSGEEQFRNITNLYLIKNWYFTINPQSYLFRSSHIKSIKEEGGD